MILLWKTGKDDVIMELKKHYTNEQTGISYTPHGDFYLPDLKLAEANITLGKWGTMHKRYLENHKKALFNSLLIKGTLFQYCAEVEKQANEMYDLLIEQMKEIEGVTEQLKEENQMAWIQKMNSIQQQVSEIVCEELIYA